MVDNQLSCVLQDLDQFSLEPDHQHEVSSLPIKFILPIGRSGQHYHYGITLFLNVGLTGGLQQYVKAADEEDGVDRRLWLFRMRV